MHKTKRVFRYKFSTQPAVILEVITRDELAACLEAVGEAADRATGMAAMMWSDLDAEAAYRTERVDLRYEGHRPFIPARKSANKVVRKSKATQPPATPEATSRSRIAQPQPDASEHAPLFGRGLNDT